MRNKITFLVVLMVFAMVLTGCALMGPFSNDAKHNRNHWKAIAKDYDEIHYFLDRHLWNYDWEDPSRN